MLEQPLGHRHGTFHIFDGLDGNPGGHFADYRQFFFRPVGVVEQLNATGAVTVEFDKALSFQGSQMVRGGILRLKAHDVGNFRASGCHTGIGDAFADTVQHLLLAIGEFAAHNLLHVSRRISVPYPGVIDASG